MTSSQLAAKLKEAEAKQQKLSKFKKNMSFMNRIIAFREQVLSWVTELCKEECKKDYDKMAQMVRNYEKTEDSKCLIKWAIQRIQTTAPTINEANRKLKAVLEAIQCKDKRMVSFVLEKNNLRAKDFFEKKKIQDDDFLNNDEEI